MDYYVVTAVSEEEERNVSCDATSYGSKHSCSISLDDSANINDYNFTIYGVTPVNSSFIYNGDSITDCCKVVIANCDCESEPFLIQVYQSQRM